METVFNNNYYFFSTLEPGSVNQTLVYVWTGKIWVQRMDLNELIKQDKLFFHDLINSWHMTFPSMLLYIENTLEKVIS